MRAEAPPDLWPEAATALQALLLAAAWRVVSDAQELLGEAELVERFGFALGYASAFEALGDEPPRHPGLSALARDWPEQAVALWLVHGLVEEDRRFGLLFEALNQALGEEGAQPGPAWLQRSFGSLPGQGLRPALRALLQAGVLRPESPGQPRAAQRFEVDEACWAALRGEPFAEPAPGLRLQPLEAAPALDELVLPEAARERLAGWRPGQALLVRGPEHNGRGSLVAALAREWGRPVLACRLEAGSAPPPTLGALAALCGALTLLRVEAAPGEALRLPVLAEAPAIVAAEEDGLEGLPADALVLTLPLPDHGLRLALIERLRPGLPDAAGLAARLHLACGHLHRALNSAAGADEAALREAALAGGAAGLARLAQRLDPEQAPPQALVLDEVLSRDLAALAARCQQRDRLRGVLPAAFAARLNAGVRALLAGPSGTGKTLAAQVLARELGLPLYRLDLSAVVSKYIGETERNLHRLLSAAQALDVMLLLDEGDALLAPRTEVGSSNDRYANLETNFLLQRLESHQGLVLVTTNAQARIDRAFMRRFDFVIPFRAPEVAERLRLWQAHLPADHALSEAQLAAVAEACTLAGGQVRNVVLDAVSAALARGRGVDAELVFEALQREYRRGGGLCPLKGL
ncbi:ATP-binding protein [Pelomonas sp. P7]|uniref:ATP-binding protein n=1 Tax=Pelomonas caseinilytica TaxID=2906763 RepID=A0ABS8XCL8_9BURK|nr:ATP-binding protein [Pelomonas sp. P7]MCE4536727.1 ATP-binding protein [Pelomonas sp. P7]